MTENLIKDANSWSSSSPNPSLAPKFRVEQTKNGGNILTIHGGGNPYCFGRWTRHIPVEGGKTYRYRVRFQISGVEDLNLNVLNMLTWRVGNKPETQCPQEYIEHLYREKDYVVGEQVFTAKEKADGVDLGLLLRYIAEGEARWNLVEFFEDEPPEPRYVTVATIRGRPTRQITLKKILEYWAELIDIAASRKPDLICLPEAMNTNPNVQTPPHEAAEPIPGPTFRMLKEKAKKYSTYVCGCLIERDGKLVFNTAVLLDRKGNMVGKYSKVHPYWPEELQGCSPGDDFPVFKTDFGVVGILICYDSWFTETTRLLALKGAEIVLFPNAGYERKLLPARAIDNNVYFVVASLFSNAVIMDTLGEALAETSSDGIISAKIDLNSRPTPHPNAGGNLNASPGGRRGTRNSLSLKLYQEILREVARWETKRDN